MSNFAVEGLEELIHVRARLAILAFLTTSGSAEFVTLRDQIKISDGNLSLHLKKLEENKYIKIRKVFVARKPKTSVSLTSAGRNAFYEYLDYLQSMLSTVPPREESHDDTTPGSEPGAPPRLP